MPEGPGRAFRRVFTRREVESLAGRRTFERGVLYAANGRVRKLTTTATSAKAKVHGSTSYQVQLGLDGDEATYACSCPVGQDDRFCKHAVAVALVATDTATHAGHDDAVVDLDGYLAELDHQALVDLLLERAGPPRTGPQAHRAGPAHRTRTRAGVAGRRRRPMDALGRSGLDGTLSLSPARSAARPAALEEHQEERVLRAHPYDPAHRRPGTVAHDGHYSWHGPFSCPQPPVISFQDRSGAWQSGCQRAVEELTARGWISTAPQGKE